MGLNVCIKSKTDILIVIISIFCCYHFNLSSSFLIVIFICLDEDKEGHGEEFGAGEEDGGEKERGASEKVLEERVQAICWGNQVIHQRSRAQGSFLSLWFCY